MLSNVVSIREFAKTYRETNRSANQSYATCKSSSYMYVILYVNWDYSRCCFHARNRWIVNRSAMQYSLIWKSTSYLRAALFCSIILSVRSD